MADDPYKVLGVDKGATQDEIKKAYRKLAKTLHPDLHPDDPGRKSEFQAVSAAYDLLRDPERRRRFDAGEIDAQGHERAERQFYRDYAGRPGAERYQPGAYEDLSDLFSDFFARRRRGGGETYEQSVHARGRDMRYHLEVDFMDAARGAKRAITMPDGKAIEVSIPAGLDDGQTLRLRGKGGPGIGQGPPGDALITVGVRPHPVFTRNGDNIEMELPVTFDEAVLGAKVDVPTISGTVAMTIPKGVSSGRQLRLKGKGFPVGKATHGDQIVRIQIVLPEKVDKEMEEIAKRWRAFQSFDPRETLRRTI
ncbi:DnaJ C-terminal domain-containing protein [Histidinibacterium aquaticum]|uniref:J domain-containing protein n=1 Tax=Histidinibacterium aquaticum TaxID=2613962 RepID=A0A5J5GIB5_9RHOB|nr:J domain-containing protein [Histidinibacterium aquaticum]KAA9007780.1 J domain-containing protein [Histidinibacterium aquaticum]